MRLTPTTELENRIKRLQQEMSVVGLDATIILQNADLFYFSGSIQQGVLFVPNSGKPIYMVRRDHARARMESGLENVVHLRSLKDVPDLLASFGHAAPAILGLELDVLPVNTCQRFTKLFDNCQVRDASPLVRRIRAIKSDYEIGILKDAALILGRVHQRAKEVIRVGMTDLDLAAELEYVARRAGHQGMIRIRGFNNELFYGHVFSGPDSAVPTYSDTPLGGVGLNPSFPQGASYKTIKEQEPITIDFGAAFDGYIVDQTRMFCIGGLPDKLVTAYDNMVAIQEYVKTAARPGVSWGELYGSCCTMAEQMGYADHFMGIKGAQVSFVGHGVGVELDEYPFIARGFKEEILEENMVFALEPKVVFPGLGAVGIENTFWVVQEGLKHITFADQELVIL